MTGEGIAALRDRIVELATGGAASEPGMLTSFRHHQAVSTGLEALTAAAKANNSDIPHEMILIDLIALCGRSTLSPAKPLRMTFSIDLFHLLHRKINGPLSVNRICNNTTMVLGFKLR